MKIRSGRLVVRAGSQTISTGLSPEVTADDVDATRYGHALELSLSANCVVQQTALLSAARC